jgi:hypothetical protein
VIAKVVSDKSPERFGQKGGTLHCVDAPVSRLPSVLENPPLRLGLFSLVTSWKIYPMKGSSFSCALPCGQT